MTNRRHQHSAYSTEFGPLRSTALVAPLRRRLARRPGFPSSNKQVLEELTDGDLAKIGRRAKATIEGDLRRELSMNIKRLMDLGCYRGFRHRRGLPLRGQRTRTNARTRRLAQAIAARSDQAVTEFKRDKLWSRPANSAARRATRRSAITLQMVSPTCTLPSTTPSSPSRTVRAMSVVGFVWWSRLQGLA